MNATSPSRSFLQIERSSRQNATTMAPTPWPQVTNHSLNDYVEHLIYLSLSIERDIIGENEK